MASLDELAQEIKHNDPRVVYAQGPLNKSKETKLFEQIVKDILDDEVNSYPRNVTSPEKRKVLKGQSAMHNIRHEGKNINLPELMKNVNFTHIQLAEKDISNYFDLYIRNNGSQSYSNTTKEISNQLEKADIHQQYTNDLLTEGEKIAVRKYTGSEYKDMNFFSQRVTNSSTLATNYDSGYRGCHACFK